MDISKGVSEGVSHASLGCHVHDVCEVVAAKEVVKEWTVAQISVIDPHSRFHQL